MVCASRFLTAFGMTKTLILSDTDRSSTLSGRWQPDSVEDLSVLNLKLPLLSTNSVMLTEGRHLLKQLQVNNFTCLNRK